MRTKLYGVPPIISIDYSNYHALKGTTYGTTLVRDRSLITGRGGGDYKTGVGASELLPIRKKGGGEGAENVLR